MPGSDLSECGEVRRSGGFGRQRESLGGLADLGRELLESAGRVQGEEPCGGAATLTLLPAIIRAYRDSHPAIGVRISESFDDEQLAALTAGRIDAGFLRAAAAPPGVQLETLLTEPVLAGLPADHRLAHRERIALSELADEPFVFFPRHRSVLAYDEFIASCRAAGFSPTIVQEASGISALGLVAAGLGITIVAASYQAVSLHGVHFVPVTGHDLTLQLAWSPANPNTALPAFLETTRQTLGPAW